MKAAVAASSIETLVRIATGDRDTPAQKAARVADAEKALSAARQSLRTAEQEVSEIVRRQGQINLRAVQASQALRDLSGIRAVIVDPKSWKREAERRQALKAEAEIFTDALRLLVTGDLANAHLKVREAQFGVTLAERGWVEAAAIRDVAQLWSDLAPARRRDPNLVVTIEQGSMAHEYAAKLGDLDAKIQDQQMLLDKETSETRQRQAELGLTTPAAGQEDLG